MDLEQVKDIIEKSRHIIQTAGFVELSEQLDQVYSDFESLQKEVDAEKQKNKNLQNQTGKNETPEEQIEESIRLAGPPESIYEGEDEKTLFCPSCWKNSKNLIKLVITPPQTTSIGKYRCSKCHNSYGNR
jgi:cell division septum initiation protein DivIVA